VSDPALGEIRVGQRPRSRRGGLRTVLRSVALALLASLLFGFAVGLWLRCQLERPSAPYLGTTPAPATAVVTQSRVAP